MKKWVWPLPVVVIIYFVFFYHSKMQGLGNSTSPDSNIKSVNNQISQAPFQKKPVPILNSKGSSSKVKRGLSQAGEYHHDKKLKLASVINSSGHKYRASTLSYEKYFDPDEIIFSGKSYRLSTELKAVEKHQLQNENIIAKLAGFAIIKGEFSDDPLLANTEVRVLFNNSTKQMNLLTGRIFIQLRHDMSESELSRKYKIDMIGQIPQLGMLEVQAREGVSILEIQQAMEESNDFSTVDLEVIRGGIVEK